MSQSLARGASLYSQARIQSLCVGRAMFRLRMAAPPKTRLGMGRGNTCMRERSNMVTMGQKGQAREGGNVGTRDARPAGVRCSASERAKAKGSLDSMATSRRAARDTSAARMRMRHGGSRSDVQKQVDKVARSVGLDVLSRAGVGWWCRTGRPSSLQRCCCSPCAGPCGSGAATCPWRPGGWPTRSC